MDVPGGEPGRYINICGVERQGLLHWGREGESLRWFQRLTLEYCLGAPTKAKRVNTLRPIYVQEYS